MPGMMLNRSKMLIRRATTRESLLKQGQVDEETRCNRNLEESNTYMLRGTNSYEYKFSDANSKHKSTRQCSSTSFILQEIVHNNPASHEVNNNYNDIKEGQDSDRKEQKTPSSKEDKNQRKNGHDSPQLDNQSYFDINSSNTRGTSFGLSVGFTIPTYGQEEDDAQSSDSKPVYPKNGYRRSRSCGVLLTLKYVMTDGNANKDRGMTNKEKYTEDVDVKPSQADVDNLKNGNTVARSRSLLQLALRDKESPGGKSGDVKKGISNDTEEKKFQNSSDKTEGSSEDEDQSDLDDVQIGRFTKAFRGSGDEEKEEVDINYINLDNDLSSTLINGSKENKRELPFIKPQLLPGAPAHKLLKEREQLTPHGNLNADKAQGSDQSWNETKGKLSLQREDSHYSCESSIDECGNEDVIVLDVGRDQKPIKVRRQGSVDPPIAGNIVLPIHSESKPGHIFKNMKSKKKRGTGENSVSYPPLNDLIYSQNAEKTPSPQTSWRAENFVGYYKNVLPPIHHAESLQNSDQSKSLISPRSNLSDDSQPSVCSLFLERQPASSLKRKLSFTGSSSGSAVSVDNNDTLAKFADNNNNNSTDILTSSSSSSMPSLCQIKEDGKLNENVEATYYVSNCDNTIASNDQYGSVISDKTTPTPTDYKNIELNSEKNTKRNTEFTSASNVNHRPRSSHQYGRDLSPELISFLTSSNSLRRGGVCEMIDKVTAL